MKTSFGIVCLLAFAATTAYASDYWCNCYCNGRTYTFDVTYCGSASDCGCGSYCSSGSYTAQCNYAASVGMAFWVWWLIVGAVCASVFVAIIYNRRKRLALDVSGGRLVMNWLGCFACGLIWALIYCCMENSEREAQMVHGGYAVLAQPVYAQVPGQPYPAQPYPAQPYPGQPVGVYQAAPMGQPYYPPVGGAQPVAYGTAAPQQGTTVAMPPATTAGP